MFDTSDLPRMREELKWHGFTVMLDPQGKRLVLMSGVALGWGPVLMVAYEGQGCMVYEIDRPMNSMRLVRDGFKLGAATAVSELLNQVVGVVPAAGVEAKAIGNAAQSAEGKA